MKRFITFLGFILAVVFTVVGVVKEQNKEATGDVSNGLLIIANQNDMAKSEMVGNKIVFSIDDFEKYLNVSQITSITITSIPAIADGCLCLGDVLVNEGQTISAEQISLLNYRVGNGSIREGEFKFKADENEYETVCKLYFLSRENSAPTLSMEDERTFNVSTHQTVTVYGKISGYDPDGDDLRYEIVTYAKNGAINLDAKTGEYTYTPIGAYFGEDYFEYIAVDKYGNYSNSRKVSLTVEKIKTDIVYSDMDEHPSHHAALTMAEKGIMSPSTIGNTTYFMPDKSVSRIDFLVMLMHAIGVNDTQSVFDTGFDDDDEIPASMKGYVYKARSMDIITGSVDAMGNYYFYPNKNITRAEAALMVNKIVNGSTPTIKPTFADKNEIPVWAQDAIYALNDLGIMTDEKGIIGAMEDLTRAQTAQMLYNLMEYFK